jgi:hypothetical protein
MIAVTGDKGSSGRSRRHATGGNGFLPYIGDGKNPGFFPSIYTSLRPSAQIA